MARCLTAVAAAASAAIVMSGSALAGTTIPAISAFGSVETYNYTGSFEEKSRSGLGNVGDNYSSLYLGDDPGGYIAANSLLDPGFQTIATGKLTYFVVINGPAGLEVPLEVGYTLIANAGPAGEAYAEVDTNLASSVLISRFGQSQSIFTGSLPDHEPTNQAFDIVLDAATYNGGFASADPVVEVDPTWAAQNPTEASQLSLSFSPGLVNGFGAPAPEPAAWAMMLLGLGAIGGVLRSGRKARPAAFAA